MQIVFAEHGVIELDFGVLLLEFLADFGVRDQGAAGDQVAQLVQQDVVLYALLEHGNAQVRVLQNVLVLLLSDEIAAREKGGGVAPVLQFVAHFVIGWPAIPCARLRRPGPCG